MNLTQLSRSRLMLQDCCAETLQHLIREHVKELATRQPREAVAGFLSGLLSDVQQPVVDPVAILTQVATEHGMTLEALRGPERGPALVAARREAITRLRSLESLGQPVFSFPAIGRLLHRHHTTIMYWWGREAA